MSSHSKDFFPFWCAEKINVSTAAHKRSHPSPSRSQRRPSRLCLAPSTVPLLLLLLALSVQVDVTVSFLTDHHFYYHHHDERRTVLPFSLVSLGVTNRNNEPEEIPISFPHSSSSSSNSWLHESTDFLPVSQHFITVSYEGASCQIPVASSSSSSSSPGETILTALERHQWYLQRQLGLTELPSDCRRGNCLTCAARVIVDPPQTNADARAMSAENNDAADIPPVISSDTGLSPAMAKQVQDAGYVLTCSSFVTGPGLELQLSQQDSLWKLVYQQRFESEETQYVARRAKARWLRKLAEKNLSQWKKETEKAWQQTTKLTEEQDVDDE